MAAPDTRFALFDAVRAGDLPRVTELLTAVPERIREGTPEGSALLSTAVVAGHASMVQLLLERGADPRWPEDDAPGGRALYEAARGGRRDMVEPLLAHGADPNVHVVASGNAVFAAARFPAIRALLEAHGGSLDPYDLVWLDEDDEVMRRVTADPSSAHAGCGGVDTAVVTRRKRDLLMRLLEAGVRVPPAPCGCRSYLLEDAVMLQLLLTRGGLDPDYPDDTGATLLHDLCQRDDPEMLAIRRRCAEVLLEAGASLEATDASGRTPLDLARHLGATDLIAVFEQAQRT